MRTFILFLLSCVSVMASATGIQFTSSTNTDTVTPGAIIVTETYTRGGQTNLVRVSKIQRGIVVFRIQKFCHNGEPVAWLSFRDGDKSFSTVRKCPYEVSVDSFPDKDVLIIWGDRFIDGFYGTNGFFIRYQTLFLSSMMSNNDA